MAGADFTKRKTIGTAAETALCRLLTAAGGVVTCNQQNRDLVADRPGAAVAHLDNGDIHLPDLTVIWPRRHVARQMHIEAKAKSPLGRTGGFGWDKHAYHRAMRWSVLSGDPVLYAVRDLDVAPLPAPGQADDPHHWWFASVWKLATAPTKGDSGPFWFWGREDFLPLPVLLEGLYGAALVPVVWVTDGPPLVL